MKLSLIDYGTNADLPQKVRESLPDDATATVFRTHLNSHLRDGRTEMHAYIKAYRALADMGLEEREGKWVAKSVPTVGDVHVDTPLGSRKPKRKDDPGSEEPDVAEFEEEKLYVPPAEVIAAAKNAPSVENSTANSLVAKMSGGESLTLNEVNQMQTLFGGLFDSPSVFFAEKSPTSKWVARILRKARKPAEVDYDTENVKRSVADPTCCDICEESAEQGWIPDDDVFESGEDAPPHHPNCQCQVEFKTRRVKKSAEFEMSGSIAKVDAQQHLVFGWASITSINGKSVTDTQGDQIPDATIEASAYDYVLHARVGGELHQDGADGEIKQIGTLIESVVLTSQKVASMLASLKLQGINAAMEMPFCGWWIGFQVTSEAVWQRVVSGELKAFSVGGKGKREKLA